MGSRLRHMGLGRQRDALALVVSDRRTRLGLSVRELARRAGVSPAYVTAIEAGRSSSTGRPPAISLDVAAGLAAALEMDVQSIVSAGIQKSLHERASHVLLYCLDGAHVDVMNALDERYGDRVDAWLHFADPREPVSSCAKQTIVSWSFGQYPYDSPVLDPELLLAAVESTVVSHLATLRGKRVGIAITDCSAVMRYVSNAATEVELESRWHSEVQRIWRTHLGSDPVVDVCGYYERDLLALGLTIDQLSTALDLIRRHDEVLALDSDGSFFTGQSSVQRLLASARPAGANEHSWRLLVDAAAETLARAGV